MLIFNVMLEKEIDSILVSAIQQVAQQEIVSDESWKKEAILRLDERIAAFNKLTHMGYQQQVFRN